MNLNDSFEEKVGKIKEKVSKEKIADQVKKVLVFSKKLGEIMAIKTEDVKDEDVVLSTWNDSWNNAWHNHWNNSWYNSGWINRGGWSKGSGK